MNTLEEKIANTWINRIKETQEKLATKQPKEQKLVVRPVRKIPTSPKSGLVINKHEVSATFKSLRERSYLLAVQENTSNRLHQRLATERPRSPIGKWQKHVKFFMGMVWTDALDVKEVKYTGLLRIRYVGGGERNDTLRLTTHQVGKLLEDTLIDNNLSIVGHYRDDVSDYVIVSSRTNIEIKKEVK